MAIKTKSIIAYFLIIFWHNVNQIMDASFFHPIKTTRNQKKKKGEMFGAHNVLRDCWRTTVDFILLIH